MLLDEGLQSFSQLLPYITKVESDRRYIFKYTSI